MTVEFLLFMAINNIGRDVSGFRNKRIYIIAQTASCESRYFLQDNVVVREALDTNEFKIWFLTVSLWYKA